MKLQNIRYDCVDKNICIFEDKEKIIFLVKIHQMLKSFCFACCVDSVETLYFINIFQNKSTFLFI